MNKSELKKAFEKNFENISVSDELKERTLKSVNIVLAKKTSHIPYIRNFAAVFVVTLLCISIYFTNSSYKKDFKSHDIQKNESTSDSDLNINSSDNTSGLTSQELKSNRVMLKSSPPTTDTDYLDPSFGMQSTEMTAPENATLKNEYILENTLLENGSITSTSKEEFLKQHPDAEKLENGYIIYENGKEILYIFENNNLENIIILN